VTGTHFYSGADCSGHNRTRKVMRETGAARARRDLPGTNPALFSPKADARASV
jgi:hypothetical protein